MPGSELSAPKDYTGTAAALMLRGALDKEKAHGRSLRQIARELNYKQAVVLSHMANGRVPVPLERAIEIALAVNLSPSEFLPVVVEQKLPQAAKFLQSTAQPTSFAKELGLIAGTELEDLDDSHKAVMREVAADPRPERRWLSVAELTIVSLLRNLRPELPARGLSEPDRLRIIEALQNMT